MTYKISFTSGGLFNRDAIKVAELYLLLHDWGEVKNQVIEHNILQARVQSSLTRTASELFPRLQGLTEAQVYIVANGARQEQNQMLWLAVCKQYPFVRDFAVEVVREKYLRLDWEISYADFDVFFYNKAEWHDELAKITESTRKKLRQVLFRMMTESEIISPANLILPAMLSPLVVKAVAEDDTNYFAVFPISDADVRKLRQ
jgi:hypothetical protein